MAKALADAKRPAEARELLEESYTTLRPSPFRRGGEQVQIGLGLAHLPIVASVAPDLFDDYFWRSLFVIGSNPDEPDMDYSLLTALTNGGADALLVAEYDAALAREMLEPFADQLRNVLAARRDFEGYSSASGIGLVVSAMSVLDPDAAVKLIDAFPTPPDLSAHRPANSARLLAAQAMLSTPQRRLEMILHRYWNVWLIDREDL
jgi:hypothetical protein